ncbi:hypothetical protein [Haloferax denitrificans]|nr:hypothetical protein [Haloferax denitrificans]
MEGAFDHPENQHTITVDTPTTSISAPQELRPGPFTTNVPGYQFQVTYDTLTEWWLDFVDAYLTKREDAMLLITNYDSGAGSALENYYAMAEGGPGIAATPSIYNSEGVGENFDDMQTALHEAGHTLLDKGPYWEHRSGSTFFSFGTSKYHRTPMGYEIGEQSCNSVSSAHDDHAEKMWYNPNCAVDNFEKTTNHLD